MLLVGRLLVVSVHTDRPLLAQFGSAAGSANEEPVGG